MEFKVLKILILFFVELMLFFLVRLSLVWKHRYQGCDAYYFLLTAEIFKKNKKIPITLPPYYLADIEEQWYPPGFSIFLGLLPSQLLKKYHWLINSMLDFINLVTLNIILWYLNCSLENIFISNLIYIFTPTLTLEYRGLTSRSLANLLFTWFMVSLFFGLNDGFLVLVAIFFWIIILLTHKLTVQLGIVMGMMLSIILKTWTPIIVIFSGIFLTIIFSKGYYLKIVKHHWDIVSFWHKNLKFQGAHQVYHSPIYGNPESYKIHSSLSIQILKLFKQLLGHNPFVLFLIVSFWENPNVDFKITSFDLVNFKVFCQIWGIVVVVWCIFTTLVPYFKALGEGYKYLKYSVFPMSVLGIFMSKHLIILGSILALVGLLTKNIENQKPRYNKGQLEEALKQCIEWIRKHEEIDYIGCISCHLCDPIVYFCRRKVLWGTHHYCFNEKVIDFFPVLRKSLKELSEKYRLKYWLIDVSYVDPEYLGFSENSCVFKNSKYWLVKV